MSAFITKDSVTVKVHHDQDSDSNTHSQRNVWSTRAGPSCDGTDANTISIAILSQRDMAGDNLSPASTDKSTVIKEEEAS